MASGQCMEEYAKHVSTFLFCIFLFGADTRENMFFFLNDNTPIDSTVKRFSKKVFAENV